VILVNHTFVPRWPVWTALYLHALARFQVGSSDPYMQSSAFYFHAGAHTSPRHAKHMMLSKEKKWRTVLHPATAKRYGYDPQKPTVPSGTVSTHLRPPDTVHSNLRKHSVTVGLHNPVKPPYKVHRGTSIKCVVSVECTLTRGVRCTERQFKQEWSAGTFLYPTL
jgi:hypothetical protein